MSMSHFLRLPEEKQQQVINASISEFAQYGYDLSSTNRLVKQAGISKGALFKYFGDKEGLFLYVCDLCTKNYMDSIPQEPADNLLEFVQRLTIYKMRYFHEHPLAYQLLVRVTKEPNHPVYAKVAQSQKFLIQNFGEVMTTVLHKEELRPGLTWNHVMSFMGWIAAGLQERYLASIPDVVDDRLEERYQPMVGELKVFLDILRFGIFGGGSDPS